MLDLIITAGVATTSALIGVAVGVWFGRAVGEIRMEQFQDAEGQRAIALAAQRLTRIIELEGSNAAYKANNTRMKQRIAALISVLEPDQLSAPAPAEPVVTQ
jgi:membrane protein YqaA with SNARE-associated domain